MQPHTFGSAVPSLSRRRPQRGIALITSLLILVVVTFLAVAMFRSVGLQEKIAGSTLEKQRSLQAAESAQRYAEWWISQSSGGSTGSPCTGVVAEQNNTSNMQVCSNELSNPTTLPWPAGVEYRPASLNVSAGGGLTISGSPGVVGDINYALSPSLYINYLGMGPNQALIYQVTASGYGGNASTASVVQSTYAMQTKTRVLSGP